jgi:tetratricopeptide (TPR) repeat protein
MGNDLDLPDEIYGFGSWLLWLVATRAPALVDRMYANGPARPSRKYGMAAGHHVPTPALIAWLLAAAEFGLSPDELATREPDLDARQKILRTTMSRAIDGEPRLVKDSWLGDLAASVGLTEPELQLLAASRDDGHSPVDPAALRTAIARTLQQQSAAAFPARDGEAATQTLPRDIASFTGRAPEVSQLIAAADTAGTQAGVVSICAIGGMAGVGKTALAVHAAHLLAPRFPDGQLFLPLHGHTPGQRPVSPAEALAGLLLTTGVSANAIPPGLEPRTALWRDRLADRRLLLVLDDAVSHDQIRPLLPGTRGSLVLITSRRHLTALEDAQTVSLDALPPDEAALLLVRLAGRAELTAADVGQLAALAGHLPLAVGMLARQLHHHPAWTPASLTGDLLAARNRLELMATENLSVAAALDLSYQDLTSGQRLLFRYLGLHPGPDIDFLAVGALSGAEPSAASQGLRELYDHYLLTEPASGRYRFHDLVREFAAASAAADPPADRDAAVGRLLDYYLHATRSASPHLAQRNRHRLRATDVPAPAFLPEFGDRHTAIEWLEAERLNLAAVARLAASTGKLDHAVGIAEAMSVFLATEGHWDQGIGLFEAAIAAASQAGDLRAQAAALIDLGVLQGRTAGVTASASTLAESLRLYQSIDDRQGEADASYALGVTQRTSTNYAASATSLVHALELYRSLGDPLGEADALRDLGFLQYATDDLVTAAISLGQAVNLFAEHGDPRGEIGALNYLAPVYQQQGQYAEAAATLTRALELCETIGDRLAEAGVRSTLGYLECLTGEPAAAAASLTRALELFGRHDYKLSVASAFNYLGVAQRMLGAYESAAASQQRALDLYCAQGSPLGQANAWLELGVAQRLGGDLGQAGHSMDRALEIYRSIGDQVCEAEGLNAVGDLRLASSLPAEALACFEQARAQTSEKISPLEHVSALDGIGRSHLAAGRPADAAAALREALALYQRLGLPRATEIEAILSDLTE